MVYNWQNKNWPNFPYNTVKIQDLLLGTTEKIASLLGGLQKLEKNTQLDTAIRVMLSEVTKNSEIEGEYLNKDSVFSSVKKHMGLKVDKQINDPKAESISQITTDAYKTYSQRLTKKQLNTWHQTLFQNRTDIVVGDFRRHKDAMQVVSGYYGKVKVHFEAPPSAKLAEEMKTFINWFNSTAPGKNQEIKSAAVRTAITHLYFESIHPYEDGNGRLGRLLAEKALAQTLGYPVFICLSSEIEAQKKVYYKELEKAQKSEDITEWLEYFLKTLGKACDRTEEIINFVISKSKFYDNYSKLLNSRQAKVIKKMLDQGAEGFEGGISAGKYMKITKCSKATATRDLQDLLSKKIIYKLEASGRSTRYDLNL